MTISEIERALVRFGMAAPRPKIHSILEKYDTRLFECSEGLTGGKDWDVYYLSESGIEHVAAMLNLLQGLFGAAFHNVDGICSACNQSIAKKPENLI